MTDAAIEQEIQAKGLTAPRITPEHIEEAIYSEHYFTAANGVAGATDSSHALEHGPLDLLTFCVLVLRNGFTVTGESACASPENFDAEIGQKIARENAIRKVWMLEGYMVALEHAEAGELPSFESLDEAILLSEERKAERARSAV